MRWNEVIGGVVVRIPILFGALTLVASAPCVLSGQNTPSPATAPPSPPPMRHDVGAMPAQHRVEARRAMGVAEKMSRVRAIGRMGGMHDMMMMDAASMFLGCTGELQLTDAQVTRLAAIARRSEARQRAMRSRMDSAMTAMRSMDYGESVSDGGAPPRAMAMSMVRMVMPTESERKAQHEDDREAFSIMTPDQLATAWEMMGRHH